MWLLAATRRPRMCSIILDFARGERVRRMAATSGMPGVVHPPDNMRLRSRGWLS